MPNRFSAEATSIPGCWLLQRKPIADERGRFERLFCAQDLAAWGHPGVIAQANRSTTIHAGAVRGMHFQNPPHGEWKVITCLIGAVYDVVVDLRRHSPSFLAWQAFELSENADVSLLVPPGCAHGFQVRRGPADMLYLHSHPYVPAADAGVRADDPRLAIVWPLPIAHCSARDQQHPLIDTLFTGLTL